MPQLGETVAEGKITKWFKAAGDAVKPGDNLFEIETDKTSMEVPATSAGTLTEIRVQVGEVAQVGAVVAVISGRRAAPRQVRRRAPAPRQGHRRQQLRRAPASGARLRGDARAAPARAYRTELDPFREVRTPERNFGPGQTCRRHVVTPLARRLAGERGIDLSRVSRLRPARPHRRAGRRERPCRRRPRQRRLEPASALRR